MSASAPAPPFRLVPRRRLIGSGAGSARSPRRGAGADVAGSRPYRPGDDVRTIDWAASARLSAARGSDEFVVREHHAEEAPRVVVVWDRRPAMSLFGPDLPWLAKDEAARRAVELLVEATAGERGVLGLLHHGGGEAAWRPPRPRPEPIEDDAGFDAPDDALGLALEHLLHLRPSLPPGTFLFVLSDFLSPPAEALWQAALARRWDVVPVVVQDAVWERSFPDVGGLVVPLADARGGRRAPVRVGAREASRRREEHRRRYERLLAGFDSLGLDAVELGSAEQASVEDAFAAWAERRLLERGRA